MLVGLMLFRRKKTGEERGRPVKSTVDLAGSGAGYATPEEMKRLLRLLEMVDRGEAFKF